MDSEGHQEPRQTQGRSNAYMNLFGCRSDSVVGFPSRFLCRKCSFTPSTRGDRHPYFGPRWRIAGEGWNPSVHTARNRHKRASHSYAGWIRPLPGPVRQALRCRERLSICAGQSIPNSHNQEQATVRRNACDETADTSCAKSGMEDDAGMKGRRTRSVAPDEKTVGVAIHTLTTLTRMGQKR